VLNKFAGACVLGIGLLAGGTVHAGPVATFQNTGDSFTAGYNYVLDGATIDATIKYIFDGFTTSAGSSTATFEVIVTNNSSGAGTNRIVSFGIDMVAPALTDVSDNTSFWSETLNTNFPGFHKIDLCVWSGTNCDGGANAGVLEGASSDFLLMLTFAGTNPTPITFTGPFPTKWQSVGNAGNSYELDINGWGPPVLIPEPGTLALVSLALFGLGALGRRARQ